MTDSQQDPFVMESMARLSGHGYALARCPIGPDRRQGVVWELSGLKRRVTRRCLGLLRIPPGRI